MVKVMEVDLARKRIALSIKQTQEAAPRTQRPQKGNHQNSTRQKETETARMEDAISLLRKKFGK